MSFRAISFLIIGVLARPGYACIIGSVAVEKRSLTVCDNLHGLGSSYSKGINNSVFKKFLEANRENRVLSEANKRLFNYDTNQLIAYFENEIAGGKYTTDMFADTDADIPELLNVAKLFNDHYKYTAAIGADQQRSQARAHELRNGVPITTISEIDQLAQINSSKIPALKEKCTDSKNADVSNVSAIEITYSDGETDEIMPVGLIKVDGQQNRGQLVYMGGNEFVSRTIFSRNGKLYWIARDGKEWEVTVNKVSYKRLTGIRPMNFGGMSDACYLSYRYEKTPGAANPVGAVGGATR
ncbi:MAG: hypothetical protein IPK68_21635 [Bdellovibrionales bacterium]|nr:hypothetical protein [Bdellovibrionales bacterium]